MISIIGTWRYLRLIGIFSEKEKVDHVPEEGEAKLREKCKEVDFQANLAGEVEGEYDHYDSSNDCEEKNSKETERIENFRLEFDSIIRKTNLENIFLRTKIHEDYKTGIQELSKQHEEDVMKIRSTNEKNRKRMTKEHEEEIRKLLERIEEKKNETLKNVKQELLPSHNDCKIEEIRECYQNEFERKKVELEKIHETKTSEEMEANKKHFKEEKQRHIQELIKLRKKLEESFQEEFEKKCKFLLSSNSRNLKELKTRKKEELRDILVKHQEEKMKFESDLEQLKNEYKIKIEEKKDQITEIRNNYELKLYQILNNIKENTTHIHSLSSLLDDYDIIFKKFGSDLSDYNGKLHLMERNINQIKKYYLSCEPRYKVLQIEEENIINYKEEEEEEEEETLQSRIKKINKKVLKLKNGEVNELSSYREPKPICVKIMAYLFQIIQLKGFLDEEDLVKEYLRKKEYQKLWMVCIKKHLSTRIRKELINFQPEKVFMNVQTKIIKREMKTIKKEEVLRTSTALYVLYQFLITSIERIDQCKNLNKRKNKNKKKKKKKKSSRRD